MALEAQPTRSPKPEATWELVLKRNPVERLKREKAPLGNRDELPALIAAGYEAVPEEDMVRLQWWGLYHDKPKVGTFMLRVKLPSGHLTAAKLRAIGEVSNRFGRGDGELATRQNIQLHWLELARLSEVFAHLDAAGITTAGGCGDTVRNITGCPLQGLDPDELSSTAGLVANGKAPDTPAAVIASGTRREQRVAVAKLDEIAAVATTFDPPALVVIGDVVDLAATLAGHEPVGAAAA